MLIVYKINSKEREMNFKTPTFLPLLKKQPSSSTFRPSKGNSSEFYQRKQERKRLKKQLEAELAKNRDNPILYLFLIVLAAQMHNLTLLLNTVEGLIIVSRNQHLRQLVLDRIADPKLLTRILQQIEKTNSQPNLEQYVIVRIIESWSEDEQDPSSFRQIQLIPFFRKVSEWVREAYLCCNQMEPNRMHQFYSEAEKLKFKDPIFYISFARLMEQQGLNSQKELADMGHQEQLNRGYIGLYCNRVKDKDTINKSLELYRQAEDILKEKGQVSGELLRRVGCLYFETRQFQLSRGYLLKYLEGVKEDAEAQYKLTLSLLELGLLAQAVYQMSLFLSSHPPELEYSIGLRYYLLKILSKYSNCIPQRYILSEIVHLYESITSTEFTAIFSLCVFFDTPVPLFEGFSNKQYKLMIEKMNQESGEKIGQRLRALVKNCINCCRKLSFGKSLKRLQQLQQQLGVTKEKEFYIQRFKDIIQVMKINYPLVLSSSLTIQDQLQFQDSRQDIGPLPLTQSINSERIEEALRQTDYEKTSNIEQQKLISVESQARQKMNEKFSSKRKNQTSQHYTMMCYLKESATEFDKLMFKNHAYLIRYLYYRRDKFKFLARHYFHEIQIHRHSGDPNYYTSFQLRVQKGQNYYLNPKGTSDQAAILSIWNKGKHEMKSWILCVIEAINQLEQFGLFHGDIAFRNTIYVAQQTGKGFVYKLIDFDRALKVQRPNGELYITQINHTRKMIKHVITNQNSTERAKLLEKLFVGAKQSKYNKFQDILEDMNQYSKASLKGSTDLEKLINKLMDNLKSYAVFYHHRQLLRLLELIFLHKENVRLSKSSDEIILKVAKNNGIPLTDKKSSKAFYQQLTNTIKTQFLKS